LNIASPTLKFFGDKFRTFGFKNFYDINLVENYCIAGIFIRFYKNKKQCKQFFKYLNIYIYIILNK